MTLSIKHTIVLSSALFTALACNRGSEENAVAPSQSLQQRNPPWVAIPIPIPIPTHTPRRPTTTTVAQGPQTRAIVPYLAGKRALMKAAPQRIVPIRPDHRKRALRPRAEARASRAIPAVGVVPADPVAPADGVQLADAGSPVTQAVAQQWVEVNLPLRRRAKVAGPRTAPA